MSKLRIERKFILPLHEMIHPNCPRYKEIHQMFVDLVAEFGVTDVLKVFEAITTSMQIGIVQTMINSAAEGLELGEDKAELLDPVEACHFKCLLLALENK